MPKKFQLGFQGWFLGEPYTGIGKHCIGLLRALAKKSEVELVIPVPIEVQIDGIPSEALHLLKPKKNLPPSLRKAYWERVQVPAFFKKYELDWEYYPYPCPLPEPSKHRRAMTVHDLILWEDPRYKGSRLKAKYHLEAKRSLVHMDRLFTVSKTIHDQLGIPSAEVLFNAVDFKANATPDLKQDLKKLVYLGGYDLRKQVPLLVHAFAEFHKKNTEYSLELLGAPLHASKLYPKIPKHPAVKERGSLSDVEIQRALESAGALIHAPDSEGFNLPLLEAMTLGLPAIVNDLPINREISQNTALFWKPSKKNELARILRELEDPKFRKKIIAEQKKVAQKYSWDRSAEIILRHLKG